MTLKKKLSLLPKPEPIAALIHRMILVIQAVTVVFQRAVQAAAAAVAAAAVAGKRI